MINDPEEAVSSELDEPTHAEMCLLYRESADTIRFAKAQQWRSLGATLMTFAVLMVVGSVNDSNDLILRGLMLVSLLLSCGAIYAMVVYQLWQNTEREKLRAISATFSSTARAIRAIKSSQEADIIRYLLLAFMIASTIIGNATVIVHLNEFLS